MDLENFLLLLIEKDAIANYVGNKENVRDIYHKLFRPSRIRISFWEFLMELWSFWYIDRFNKSIIHFNSEWIDYLNYKAKHKSFVKNNKGERKYITEKSCKLCAIGFNNERAYSNHKEELSHKIRMQYVMNKQSFKDTIKIEIELMDDEYPIECIKAPARKNINLQIKIENTSDFVFTIRDIVKVNMNISEIDIRKKNFPYKLNKDESIIVPFNGSFENSTKFIFPLVVVAEVSKTFTEKLILKEIPVEITTEYSNLADDEGYASVSEKSSSKPVIKQNIVPGKRLIRASNNKYIQSVPLLPYEIPLQMTRLINLVVKLYPEFIQRTATDEFSLRKLAIEFFKIETRIQKDNYCHILHTLLHLEENQMKVDIKDYSKMSLLKHLNANFYSLQVAGLAESRPSLLIGDSVYIKEFQQTRTTYQGIVHTVMETSVVLGFNTQFRNLYSGSKMFFVEFGFNRRPLKVEHQAVDLVRKHNTNEYFFPDECKLIRINREQLQFFNTNLNAEQKLAVRNILDLKDVPYLLFGPPGTGKTFTLVEAILQVWKTQKNTNILVCTPSNASANEITSRLAKYLPHNDIFRLLGSIYGHDNHYKFDNIVNVDKNGDFFMPDMGQLLKYRVMLTTVVTAARLINGGLPNDHYSYVFIDESGYATEPETLIPVAGVLSNMNTKGKITGQLVLAGDPKQLGPRIHSNFVKFCGLGTSMLERLMSTCNLYARNEKLGTYNSKYVTKLIRNYRSHPEILKVPNDLFYNGDLIAMGNEYSNIFSDWRDLRKQNFPLLFHNVEGDDRRDKDSPSFYNIQEVEVTMEYLSKIMRKYINNVQIKEEHIGIISPYRKQVLKLKEACNRKNWRNILIGSVEQFQGKEKMIIIISTVRSKSTNNLQNFDKKFELGFLRNPKRFNVAVTRSKALLIIIGNANLLKNDKNWNSLLKHCIANNSVMGKGLDYSKSSEVDVGDFYRSNVNDTDEGFEGVAFPYDNI